MKQDYKLTDYVNTYPIVLNEIEGERRAGEIHLYGKPYTIVSCEKVGEILDTKCRIWYERLEVKGKLLDVIPYTYTVYVE